jgi:hypothetical protein
MEDGHRLASAPQGALRLNLRDYLTSKLDGYPADFASPLRAKPVHDENRFGKIAPAVHKIDSSFDS